MDDAEYLFKQDAREKKQIARSARNKVRHTGCKLPSDYMTQQEKKTLNGEVKTMNIRKPMTYLKFKMLDKDLKEEFLRFLKTEFNCTGADVAKAFKMFPNSLRRYFKTAGIRSPFTDHPKRNALDEERWNKFWAGEEWKKPENPPESLENARSETNSVSEGESAVSENAPESDEKARSETNDILNEKLLESGYLTVNEYRELIGMPTISVTTIDEVVTEQPFSMGSMNVCLKDIRDWGSVVKALSSFPLPLHNSVTITIHEIKEE